jgi:hypothetical protein
MTETSNSPTEHSTRPLGNTDPQPTPLDRIIGANAAAKMKQIHPDARRAVDEMIARKRQGQDGHAKR